MEDLEIKQQKRYAHLILIHWIKTAFSTVLAKLAFYLQKNGVIRFISCTWYNNQFKIDQRP